MTSKIESEFPSSPENDETDEGDHNAVKQEQKEEEEVDQKPINPNVASILARLQSSGALVKKQEYRCHTCDIDFRDWEDLENHLITHVSLPSIVLDKLPSDEEDLPASGDENWSDEDEIQTPSKPVAPKTPQKIDISQIIKKGLCVRKKSNDTEEKNSDAALSKLSGLGFTIKKNVTPIKKEKPDNEYDKNNDVMQKLGKLGGIKLKLKCDGNNTNSFKVVNGLKDFKASDDEEENSCNEEDLDNEKDKSCENEGSGEEQDSDDHQNQINRNRSDSSDSEKTKTPNLPKGIQAKLITPKKEPPNVLAKNIPIKIQMEETAKVRTANRPVIKQTPKRTLSNPVSKENEKLNDTSISRRSSEAQSTPERSNSADRIENVVVKQEVIETPSGETQNMPLFTAQIKSERSSPPLSERTTPVLAHIKSEPETSTAADTPAQTSYPNTHISNSNTNSSTTPLLPVTKTEDITVIEINGDSNDEDDDCCVVSTTPAPDVKPIVPKVEKPVAPPYPTNSTTFSTSQTNYNTLSASRFSTAPSTEQQLSYNWHAPDNKPSMDILDKSTDDIFESLLSSTTKKENMSMSDANEYISLDTLGPQHSCDVCNTRFTDVSLLEEHIRVSGHSKTIVTPTSSLMPYNHPSSNILSSLLPVKQLAEQVGKLSTIGNSGPGFTHQQNVMINIQAYPGAGGVIVPPQYNAYNSAQSPHGSYPQASNNMYGSPGQQMPMPNQYPGQNYMNSGYGQYQTPPMSKSSYPGSMQPNVYSMASSPYSTASPLQSMQQAVYGQSGMMNPPGSSPSHSYAPASSPGGMKQPQTGSGIKIQNVQTFPPGQIPGPIMPGQSAPGQSSGPDVGQMAPPSQPMSGQVAGGTPIRMAAGAHVSSVRPRIPTIRGQRPTLRPGIQVQGQVRGGKMGPRMPLKRPGVPSGGPGQKRKSDMLLPGKHDNEDCQVMSLQKQREGLPLIQSVQGARDKLNFGSQISVTKKTVNKEANAMANVLASRGICVTQKQKSRSPTPDRPLPHIPNLGAGMSIKHTSKSSKFSIPEARVGGGMYTCKICKKMFMNHNSLQVHMSNAHPQSKIPVFKCDECPASYPKSLQLQHHKRVFHNVTGPNRELGLPVVDLSQEDNLKRLSSLGIYSFIPLANREQAHGCFGIPVISVHNMQNGLTSSLQALGADGLLSLGPLKPLPNT